MTLGFAGLEVDREIVERLTVAIGRPFDLRGYPRRDPQRVCGASRRRLCVRRPQSLGGVNGVDI